MFVADGGLSDTIVARATADGAGARAVIRISGEAALRVAGAVFRAEAGTSLEAAPPLSIVTGVIAIEDVRVAAKALRFEEGRSFTGEACVELHTVSSPPLVERVLSELARAGARLARPGEFTRRAFTAGRIDLAEAEAVLALSSAGTEAEARRAALALRGGLSREVRAIADALADALADLEAAIDFAHENIEAELLARAGTAAALEAQAGAVARLLAREAGRGPDGGPPTVLLYGPPNAGKSSLLNALTGAPVSIAGPLAGTTRDLVSAVVRLEGSGAEGEGAAEGAGGALEVSLVDAAGVREVGRAGEDAGAGAGSGERSGTGTGTKGRSLEEEAAGRAREGMRAADLVVVVLDGSRPLGAEERAALAETAGRPRIVLATKSDLCRAESAPPEGALGVSARTGEGLAALRAAIRARLAGSAALDAGDVGPNARHRACLERASDALSRARATLGGGAPPDLAAIDLRAALDALGDVVGATTPDDLLDRIFARFCIGK